MAGKEGNIDGMEGLEGTDKIKIWFLLCTARNKGNPFRNFFIQVEYKKLYEMSWRTLLERKRKDRVEGFDYRPEEKFFCVKDKTDKGEGKRGWHMECIVANFLIAEGYAEKNEFGVIVYYPEDWEQFVLPPNPPKSDTEQNGQCEGLIRKILASNSLEKKDEYMKNQTSYQIRRDLKRILRKEGEWKDLRYIVRYIDELEMGNKEIEEKLAASQRGQREKDEMITQMKRDFEAEQRKNKREGIAGHSKAMAHKASHSRMGRRLRRLQFDGHVFKDEDTGKCEMHLRGNGKRLFIFKVSRFCDKMDLVDPTQSYRLADELGINYDEESDSDSDSDSDSYTTTSISSDSDDDSGHCKNCGCKIKLKCF